MSLRITSLSCFMIASVFGQGVEHLTKLWNNAPGAPPTCYTHMMAHKSWGDWADKKDKHWSWSRNERNITGAIVWADFLYAGLEKYPRTYIGRHPDSGALKTDPTYNRCRPSTYMDPNADYSESIFGITVAFLFYCVVQAETSAYMAEFAAFNPKAVVMYTHLANPYTSVVTEHGGTNPLPNTPLLMTSGYNAEKRREDCMAGRNCNGGPYPEMYDAFPDQTCDFYGKGKFKGKAAGNNPWANFPTSYTGKSGGQIGWWIDSGNGTVYAQIASYQAPSGRALLSDASMVFFKFYSALAFITVIFSCYVLFKLKKRTLSWPGYVVIMEGVLSSGCRGYQMLYEPFFQNVESVYFHANFVQIIDVPFSISSTWVTFMIWLKIVLTSLFNLKFSTKVAAVWNGFVSAGAIVLVVILFIQAAGDWSYARRPWVPELLAKDADKVRMDANNTVLYLNIAFVGAFGAVCFLGLVVIMRALKNTSSGSLARTIKTMLKWISLQIVGTIFFIWGFWMNSHQMRHQDYVTVSWTLFYQHGKPIGGLTMSIAQIMAVFSSVSSS